MSARKKFKKPISDGPVYRHTEVLMDLAARAKLNIRPHQAKIYAGFADIFIPWLNENDFKYDKHAFGNTILQFAYLLYFWSKETNPGEYTPELMCYLLWVPKYPHEYYLSIVERHWNEYIASLPYYYIFLDTKKTLKFSVRYDFGHPHVRQTLNVPSGHIIKAHRLGDGKRAHEPVGGETYTFNAIAINAKKRSSKSESSEDTLALELPYWLQGSKA